MSIVPFWIAAVALIAGGYLWKQRQQQTQSPVGKLSQFWERNKDWLIQAIIAVLVVFFAPSFAGKKYGKFVQFGAGAYAAYLVFKNWNRIQESL